ncbi:MAG: S9 family peptidase [Desulfurococcales archaeon]|nr:S9 family peptidase [Desulfurococcales archaeon]
MRYIDFKDILEITFVSNPEVSPSDSRVAYIISRADHDRNSYVSGIWLAEDVGEYYPLTRGPYNFCPTWSSDGRLIAFIEKPDSRDDEKGSYINVVKPGIGEPWRLARLPMGAANIQWLPDSSGIIALSKVPARDDKWVDYKDRVVLESTRIPLWFNGEGWVFDRFNHLYLVTYPGGEVIRLTSGERNVTLFAALEGKVVYVESYDMLNPLIHRVRLLDIKSMEDSVIIDGYTISAIAVSPDGTKVAFRGHRRERGAATHHKIYIADLKGNVECLTCDLDISTINSVNSDVRGPSCTRQLYWIGGEIYFPVHRRGRVSIYRVGLNGDVESHLDMGDSVIDEFSINNNGMIAFTLMKPTMPKEVYLLKDGTVSKLTEHNRSFQESRRLIEPEAHSVENNGHIIDYWVLRSPSEGGDCRRCKPWILYIHGGPKTSYGYAFIHELQLLASKGFTVIYSNPRGSDGYSEEFADIRGKYGEDDYRDLMRVVDDALSKYQELDPEKGGVTGGSYGGWMTNWIVTHTDRFKAAVTQRSCSNWITFYGVSDIGWYFAEDQHAAGPPWEDPEKYIEKSPLFHVDRVKTPLLIIHASGDYRCPLEQAIQLFTALKRRGVEAKIAIFPGENHDLSRRGRPKQRIERLKQITEWFNSHLKNIEETNRQERKT